jgi:hypothetical protein
MKLELFQRYFNALTSDERELIWKLMYRLLAGNDGTRRRLSDGIVALLKDS